MPNGKCHVKFQFFLAIPKATQYGVGKGTHMGIKIVLVFTQVCISWKRKSSPHDRDIHQGITTTTLPPASHYDLERWLMTI